MYAGIPICVGLAGFDSDSTSDKWSFEASSGGETKECEEDFRREAIDGRQAVPRAFGVNGDLL